jgi:hypothetical protein
MQLDLKPACSTGLKQLIRAGIFPDFKETGRYQPSPHHMRRDFREREMHILHYADLRGPLYRNAFQWRRVQIVVHGFTQEGLGITRLTLPNVWGTIPASFETMKAALPGAFAATGLERTDSDPGGRHWSFRVDGGEPMESLPEPYGKWFQHRQQRPRWGESIRLRLEVRCVLNFLSERTTSLDCEMSAFAPAVMRDVGHALAQRLGLRARLRFAPDYFRQMARFKLKSEPVSLATLELP